MINEEMRRLEKIDRRIQEIGEENGLDFEPIDFEIVPARRMCEVMAYGLPVNYRHWSFGRDYDRQRTIYEHSGSGMPYEMVLNTSPPKAYLMENNPFVCQVLVIAHVYGHVDFFRMNVNFKKTSRDILAKSYEAAARFGRYEHYHGLSATEPLIDAGQALQFNIDPDIHKKSETRQEQWERLYANKDEAKPGDGFSELFPQKKKKRPDYREFAHKTPLEPTRDVLGYIIQNSPKPLQEWEQDMLSVIRAQGMYLYPQLRTKIANEGWAAYWHERIMRQLFKEKYLTPEEHGTYTNYHSAVLAPNPFQLNPYYLGKNIFMDIKDRWDKGKFGREWEECDSDYDREHWDTGYGKGDEKIFKVRKIYSDRMLLEHFLTDELIHKLQLYIYEERPRQDGGSDIVVVENDPEVIRYQLKQLHADGGMPRILVQNGNYKQQQELYLVHQFEGSPLETDYLEKTLEHIYYLWGRPVHLQTVDVTVDKQNRQQQQPKVYHYDGEKHTNTDLQCGSTCVSCDH